MVLPLTSLLVPSAIPLIVYGSMPTNSSVTVFMAVCYEILVIQLSHNLDLCVTWKKGTMRVWPPYTTLCEILPVFGSTMQILDEMYRRSVNFINDCISNKQNYSNVAHHGVFLSFMRSQIDK